MPEMDVAAKQWRGIDELAGLIGAYCWVENRIFELSGVWATGTGDGPWGGLEPAQRVWCAGVSRHHGLLAASWAERLPVRAGVDRGGLVAAPAGPLAGGLDALAGASEARVGLAVKRVRSISGEVSCLQYRDGCGGPFPLPPWSLPAA